MFEKALHFRDYELSQAHPSMQLDAILNKMEGVVRNFAHLGALQVGANGLKGAVAELFLSSLYPEMSVQMHIYVQANAREGPIIRKYDMWCSKSRVAFECKSVLKPENYRKQWRKDMRLLQLGEVEAVQWHFIPVANEDVEHKMSKLRRSLFYLPTHCQYLENRAFVFLYKRINLENLLSYKRSRYVVCGKTWKFLGTESFES